MSVRYLMRTRIRDYMQSGSRIDGGREGGRTVGQEDRRTGGPEDGRRMQLLTMVCRDGYKGQT